MNEIIIEDDKKELNPLKIRLIVKFSFELFSPELESTSFSFQWFNFTMYKK